MAFATGKASIDAAPAKRYIGIAPVKVLAVNPNAAALEAIYNYSPQDKEPEYTGVTTIGEDQHEVPYARIDFVVRTDADNCNGIETTSTIRFFLQKEPRFNGDKSKVQVIDKYGRTAWVTSDQLKSHEIPVYANGPANIDASYRPAYRGEEDLTKFLVTYLNIPNVMDYDRNTKTWKMKENTSDSEARLEHIEDYFKGDFSELNSIVKLQPNNKLRVLFGVRTTDDNRLYQDIYTRMFLRNNAINWDKLELDVTASKNAGAYPNTEFDFCPLKEYVVAPTPIATPVSPSEDTSNDDPWNFG